MAASTSIRRSSFQEVALQPGTESRRLRAGRQQAIGWCLRIPSRRESYLPARQWLAVGRFRDPHLERVHPSRQSWRRDHHAVVHGPLRLEAIATKRGVPTALSATAGIGEEQESQPVAADRPGACHDRKAALFDGCSQLTGRPAVSVREFVSLHAEEFGGRRSYKAHRAKSTAVSLPR